MIRKVLIAMIAITMCLVSGCSGEKPVGPDVAGMGLVEAKAALKKANVNTTVHAKDALFGVLIEANFVVCEVKPVNANMVRLEVAKHGC